METNKNPSNKFSPEVRARAVRMVQAADASTTPHSGGKFLAPPQFCK
jgi:hypothetical protein